MPQPSSAQFLGVAKEATRGTAVASTDYIPLSKITPENQIPQIIDDSMRGSNVANYGSTPGSGFSVIGLEGQVFVDTFGYLLGGILGDVASTGSAPVVHTMATDNSTDFQPGAWTLAHQKPDGSGTPTDQYAGCMFTDVALKWDPAGLLTHTSSAMGFLSTAIAKPTQSFSTLQAQPAWSGSISIAGSSVAYVQDGEIDFKRAGKAILAVNGTQSPYQIWVDPLAVTGKFNVIFETEAEMTNFRAGGGRALTFDWTQGASSTLTELKVQMTKATYTKATYDFGDSYIKVAIEFDAGGNTTDAGATGGQSNVKATIKSAKAAGSYQ